jgi:phosphotransacetylase
MFSIVSVFTSLVFASTTSTTNTIDGVTTGQTPTTAGTTSPTNGQATTTNKSTIGLSIFISPSIPFYSGSVFMMCIYNL